MGMIEDFFEYAAEFEKTFVDDDWSRLEKFFAPDAVYEVRGAAFACRLEGPEAIFRGIKKSLDGFDRKMSSRKIDVPEPPTVEDDRVHAKWTVTYGKAGAPDFVLRGASTATYRDGRIVELVDEYDSKVDGEVKAWATAHAPDLDASYT